MLRITKCHLILLLVVSVGVLLVHGEALTAEKTNAPLKIRTCIYSDPVTLDPAKARHTPARSILYNIFQGLVAFDNTAEPPFPIIPVLAKSYKVSKDAKVITFELHKGVQFHRG